MTTLKPRGEEKPAPLQKPQGCGTREKGQRPTRKNGLWGTGGGWRGEGGADLEAVRGQEREKRESGEREDEF